jgi:ribosomal protein L28
MLPRLMARRCIRTGKGTGFGNTRSHSLRHTRRTWKANIQKKRVFDPKTGEYKTIKVAASYLRTLAKRLQEGKAAY